MTPLFILGLFSAPAMADPATMTAIGAYITSAAFVIQIALTVAMTVYGQYQQRKAKAKAKRDYNAGLEDRMVTSVSTDHPHTHIYGTSRVGGGVVAMFSSGGRDELKHLVIVHAAHECAAALEYFINGKSLGVLDSNGQPALGSFFNLGITESEQHFDQDTETMVQTLTVVPNPSVTVKTHLGSPSDPVDAGLHSALPTLWPATAVLRGFCYSVITLNLNNSEFQSGIPGIEVLLQGKKVYDPRNSSTAFSANPALCLRDYLTGVMCNVPAADIPDSYFIAAANACDVLVPFTKEGITTNQPKYTLNGTVTSDQAQQDVLQSMASAMAGSIVSTTWEVFAGAYAASTLHLYQSDIIGSVSINPGNADSDKFNGIKVRYASADNGYVPIDGTPYQNAAYRAADGKDLFIDMAFQFTSDLQRVHNLCRIYTEDQRQAYTVQADFSLKAWSCQVGQRVLLTMPLCGISAKTFRVIGKSFAPATAVTLTLKEDAASIWDLADEVVLDATPNTNLANPFQIDKLASLTAASGTSHLLIQADGSVLSRIKLAWPLATTGSVVANGAIDIEYKKLPSDIWQKTTVAGSEIGAYLSDVADGETYAIRARATDGYINASSDWTYANLHVVLGKTEPPPSVQGLQATITSNGILLSWHAVPKDVLDYSATSLQRGTAWDAQPTLTTKTSTTHLAGWLPAGSNTFLAKHFDTSGNASVSAASAAINIAAPSKPIFTRSEVEENILTLQWQDCKTSQPLKRLIYKTGLVTDTYATATDYGTDGGAQRVTMIKFKTPGIQRVFVAAEDVAGNVGQPAIIDVSASLPRNYVLSGNYVSDFSGAMTNAVAVNQGGLHMLVHEQTWQQHFSANGWATTAAKVASGNMLFFQPSTATAQYSEEYDIGKVLSSSTISVVKQYQWIAGAGTIVPTISYRDTTSAAWVDVVGSWVMLASNFRYVRLTINVTAAGGNDLLHLQSLATSISLREVTETTMLTSNASDADGTLYVLQRPIIDITAQSFSPMGTAAAYVDVIPDDTVTPAVVRVKAWDASATRVTVLGNLTITGTTV